MERYKTGDEYERGKETTRRTSEEEFETFVENAIDAFEEKVQKNEYIDEIEEFFQLLEKANRWDDLNFIWKRISWNSQQKPVIVVEIKSSDS